MDRDKTIIIFVFISCALIGLYNLIMNKRRTIQRKEFAIEFLKKIRSYVDSRGEDLDSYSWLIHRSTRLQREMGSMGVYSAYRPPFQNYRINNYQIILNLLPEIRKEFEDRLVSISNLVPQYANAIQEAIVRHIGILDDLIEKNDKEIRNPSTWLREGVREIIALPINIFSWLGVISEVTVSSITRNLVFRSIAAFVTLIGFVSGIMGIVLGWDPFLKLLRNYFK